ncbi:MAG: acetate--CoA ligase family protein [Pseudomonadota bacterium]|nr:acetate--CoA ligase family protein [Pseudomonadota bacterium]
MPDLVRLLSPKSIAFIGGAECEVAIGRTRDLGFKGRMWAVHPKRAALGGIACVKTVGELDGVPDAAFIAVKREPTIDIVRGLRAIGCGGAVVYASGFSETGDAQLQTALLEAAGGMPLLGPNCYGFVNGMARAALWPDEHGIEPCDGGVAIITQSGNIAVNFSMTRRALPLAAVFAIGNQADVDMAQMLEALADDPRITAIGLHVEGLRDVPAYARAAETARARRKPVVVLKTGRSEQGARVALSHTSSLAGTDTLYDSLFRRHAIARVNSITAFVETLKFLHHGGALSGNRIVSMSCSGGEAALIADMALGHELRFPPFAADARASIAATLNDYVVIDNPLDYHTFIWNQEDQLTATFTAVLRTGHDVAVLILDIPTKPGMRPDTWLVTARAIVNSARAARARTAVVASLPECMPEDVARMFAAAGIAPMMGLDDALAAFEAAAFIGTVWTRGETPPVLEATARRGCGERPLSEFDAKQLLAAHGLAVPAGMVCDPRDAITAAKTLGYPVTLKASSSAIAHKTEVGGVALDLRTAADVTAAALRLEKLAPRVLVERMVKGAVAELIVGLKADPQFGLALVIGAGGVLAELLQDTATLILPASPPEIERALQSLKIWRLVAGYRGKAGDGPAVVAAIAAVAAFAEAHRGLIEEVDVNPLLVLPPGKGAVAVDVLIRMRSEQSE